MGPRWTEAGVAQGGIPWWRESFFASVRSPPSAGWAIQGKMALRGGPEMRRKAVFSEGCALRVRKYGPGANQGISSSPPGRRGARGQKVAMLWLAWPLPRGRAEFGPPRIGLAPGRWSCWVSPQEKEGEIFPLEWAQLLGFPFDLGQ